MIAILEGSIKEHIGDLVVVDCGGVGYGVSVTQEDNARLPKGTPARLYIYEHIREQSYDLFGFVDISTKQLFEQLLSVNGVGPKMALSVLSIAPASDVKQAIASGNVGALTAASGVGKRVAERIVVDLKDKVGLVGVNLEYGALLTISTDEAVDALISLGYSTLDAQKALQGIDTSLSIEERITLALQNRGGR